MDDQSNDPRLEQAFVVIRQVVAEAEARGVQRVIDQLRELTLKGSALPVGAERNALAHQGEVSGPIEPPSPTEASTKRLVIKRKRARTGLVREVVMRELAEAPTGGLTPSEIASRVRTDEERAISASSFRSELRAGGDAGIYKRVEGGKWVLAHDEEQDEKARSAVESNPAFSLGEPEGR
jgi:hypothetical protein